MTAVTVNFNVFIKKLNWQSHQICFQNRFSDCYYTNERTNSVAQSLFSIILDEVRFQS
jgi:hypothetical protein